MNGSQPVVKPGAGLRRPDVVLSRLLHVALRRDSPIARLARRPVNNGFYSMSARRFVPTGVMTFLNMGYLSEEEPRLEDTADIADRVSERLYDRIVRDTDLGGRDVVEVGCGPGAGSAHLASAYRPASMIGIDLNNEMIAWCVRRHQANNLRYLQGDAQDLPLADESVDVLVNLESSHCYPSRPRFFEEAVRVLRPGGVFLFADVVNSDGGRGPDLLSAQMRAAGLEIEERVDIACNVLAARDAVSRSDAFRAILRRSQSPLMVPLVEQALCLTGTGHYERLASGRVRYLHWRARKASHTADRHP